MSVNVEKIINEIMEGNIKPDKDNDYRIFIAYGLPHYPCFAYDGEIDCLTRNDWQRGLVP